jgi:hypothetical protein
LTDTFEMFSLIASIFTVLLIGILNKCMMLVLHLCLY